jgi:hypothetical protein
VDKSANTPSVTSSGPRAAPKKRTAARLACAGQQQLQVVSDLSPSSPVTDGEIALVMGMLGDALVHILDSESPECPTLPPLAAA